jgi:hypothetical protein
VIDARYQHEDRSDTEALIRAAGSYVRASDDLRPRVLEAARLQHRERRARRWIRQAAVLALLAAFATVVGRRELDDEKAGPFGIVAAAGFDEFFVPTASVSKRSGDGDWRMIEAFTALRQQQARVLRFAL